MRSDIERYLAGRPVHAVVPPPPPPTTFFTPSPTPDATTVRAPEDDDGGDRSRALLLVLLGFLLVALIGGAAYLLPQMFESAPDQQRVPDLIGMSETDARAEIGNAGLSVGEVTYRADPDGRKDQVLEQDPNPDLYVDPGTEVDLVVSSGKPLADVPYVIGQQRDAARTTLSDAGFQVKFQERQSDEPQGQVLETDPAPGASVPEGSVVTVFYSDGPEEIPDVVGMTQEEAERTLREAGYVPDVVESANTTEPKGTVIQQSPPAGQQAQEGSTVTIVVSSYEEPSESPSPTESPTESPTLPTESPSAT